MASKKFWRIHNHAIGCIRLRNKIIGYLGFGMLFKVSVKVDKLLGSLTKQAYATLQNASRSLPWGW
jgi:hypothetical protein